MSEYILEMNHITKKFPGVTALDDVNFKVKNGEIHALVGENGAGKSTLMKVLSGVYPASSYDGDIVINGKKQEFQSIKDSETVGIAVIYQELALIKLLSIAENIYLGNEFQKNGIIDWDKTYAEAQKAMKEVRLNEDPETRVIELGVGKQQLVEVAKAVSKNVKLLVLDEPTSSLNETDTKNLFAIIKELQSKGVTCIYISHKLEEIMEIADTVTILRDGKTICTRDMHNPNERLTMDEMISHMVGRKITQRFPKKEHKPGDVVFEINNWTVYNPEIHDKVKIDHVNLSARKGEILGIAGLMGAGRTELAMSLIGAYGYNVSGEIKVDGKKVSIKTPKDAINNGISYLSEDRKTIGLVLKMDIMKNTTLASLEKISKYGVLNTNEEIKSTNNYVERLNIKTPSIEQRVENLSGGNQQKVSLAKWLMTEPKILILDEPTRGIDVGAKYEIYNIMNDLVDRGVCVIMISSELPEILGMSDRILVMNNGRITVELSRKDATQEKIMLYATGGK